MRTDSSNRAQNWPPRNWGHIIWREWRNCDDEEYARHLFDLVVGEPTDWRAAAVLVLLGVIFGAIGGWLLALLLYPENLNASLITGATTLGIIIGGVAGLQMVVGVRLVRQSSWGTWLQCLTPNKPLTDKQDNIALNSHWFGLIVGLSSGIGVGITGALFFGQPNPQFYTLLIGLLNVSIAAFLLSRRTIQVEVLIGILVGLSFGLFFGLGLAQIVGRLIVPLDVPNSARVVGLAVGIGAGLFLGRKVGFVGVLVCQVVVTVLILVVGSNLVLLGWLVGLLVGGVIAATSKMYLSAGRPDFADVYAYRTVFLWWLGRPLAAEVEAVLRQHASEEVWQELFRDLEKQQKQPESPEALWAYLRKPNWVDHFVGRHALVALGGEAIPHLLAVAGDPRTHPLRQTATWLVRSIGHETTTRLAEQADRLLCLDCLTSCGSHKTTRLGFLVTYYGCRTCGQSREFLHCPQGVVAVLDRGWTEAQPHHGDLLRRIFGSLTANSPKLERQAQDDGLLRVNWLARRELFDFDRVEIIQATDEDVERFAVQVGNDTDPVRDVRYSEMQCLVAPQCQLSENTLRVLRHTFGQVERGEGVVE